MGFSGDFQFIPHPPPPGGPVRCGGCGVRPQRRGHLDCGSGRDAGRAGDWLDREGPPLELCPHSGKFPPAIRLPKRDPEARGPRISSPLPLTKRMERSMKHRPFACGVSAQIVSIYNSDRARPNCVSVRRRRVLGVHPKDAVLVAVKRDWLAVRLQIGLRHDGNHRT